MKQLVIVFLIIAIPALLGLLGILIIIRLARRSAPRPCYRCAVPTTIEYMGLPYCMMCRYVVIQMLPAVRHDPPFGFPGSPGHVEFPDNHQEKKEK